MFRQLLNVSINTLTTVIERIQFNLALRHNGKKLNHSEITQVKRKQKAISDLCLGFKEEENELDFHENELIPEMHFHKNGFA